MMTLEQINDKLALKELVDTFSNLADEKKVADQMVLFTDDAEVNTYIGGKLVFEMKGKQQIEDVFTNFLAGFHTVYHLNGQHTASLNGDKAEAINYCQVILVENKDGKDIQHAHSVRYQDSYRKENGVWLISNRVANFMISNVSEIKK